MQYVPKKSVPSVYAICQKKVFHQFMQYVRKKCSINLCNEYVRKKCSINLCNILENVFYQIMQYGKKVFRPYQIMQFVQKKKFYQHYQSMLFVGSGQISQIVINLN
jgi:hypothetical protein